MRLRSIALWAAWFAVAWLLPAAARAESAPPDRPVTIDDIHAEEESRTARWTGLWRARGSYPQTLSGGIGAIRAKLPEDWVCVATCRLSGWVFQVEPGLHGGQIRAGYATLMAEKRHRDRFLSNVWVGFGVKGVVLRTWGGANVTPPDQTLAGIELSFTVTRMNFSLGTLRRISSGSAADWIITGGVGLGF